MNSQPNQLQNIILIMSSVMILALGSYLLLNRGTNNLNTESGTLTRNEIFTRSGDIFGRLQSIQSININTAIFSNPQFIGLQTFTQSVPEQPVGKQEIFEPAISQFDN
jgi:hypothetical protein